MATLVFDKIKNLKQRSLSGSKSNLPDAFCEKRDKVLAFRRELDEVVPLYESWIAALVRMKTAGCLLQSTDTDTQLQQVGTNIVNVFATAKTIELLQEGLKTVQKKTKILKEVDSKSKQLEVYLVTRNRYKRKKEDSISKLMRRAKGFSTEDVKFQKAHEKAIWDYEELLSNLTAELDFLLKEGENGFASEEIALLNSFFTQVLPTACTGPAEPLQLLDTKSSMKAFLERRENFVRQERFSTEMKEKLLAEGVVPMGKRLTQNLSSPPDIATPVLSPKAAKILHGTSTCPDLLKKQQIEEHQPLPKPLLEHCTVKNVPSEIVTTRPPSASEGDIFGHGGKLSPSSCPEMFDSSYNTYDDHENPAEGRSACMHDSVSVSSEGRQVSTGRDTSSSFGSTEEIPISSEIQERMREGFLIAEKDGWKEFVDRETGDEFYVNCLEGIITEKCPF